MKLIKFFLYGCLLFLIASCVQDTTPLTAVFDAELKDKLAEASLNDEISSFTNKGKYQYYIVPDEEDLINIPQDPKNPLTKEKVELGKMLFYETALAQDAKHDSGIGTYSCASCHIPSAGFRPGRAQGIADGAGGYGVNGEIRVRNQDYDAGELDVQAARAINIINVAYVTNTFWNGQFGATEVNEGTEHLWDNDHAIELNHLGFQGIETQNIEGLDAHRITINKDLIEELGYKEMFDNAFPDVHYSERYTRFQASLAYSAYIRTILANKSPFQRFLKGESSAMSLEEKKGAILFFGKARCSNCHYKPNLGSTEFHALGVNDMYQIPSFADPNDERNLGRASFTGEDEDMFAFKVPGIYNMGDSPFYFHGSSKRTLEELIDYKIEAQSENPNIPQSRISEKFLPIAFEEGEREQLLLFLQNGLRDPDLLRYQPEEVFSGNCIPNNDPQSRADLGCN